MKKFGVAFLLIFLVCSSVWSDLRAETDKEIFDRGVVLLKDEQFKEAVDLFSRLLETVPDNPDVYKNRGVAYMKLGEYDLAILDFEKTREIRPDMKGLYSNLGVAWYYKGEYEKAIKNYNMEIALTPDNHYAFFNRAICNAELNEVEKSLGDVDKALALSPDFYLAQCLRGDLLARMGKISLAREAYQKAVEIDPDQGYAQDQMAALPGESKNQPDQIVEKPMPSATDEPPGTIEEDTIEEDKIETDTLKTETVQADKMPAEKMDTMAVNPPATAGESRDMAGADKKILPEQKPDHKAPKMAKPKMAKKRVAAYELQAGAYHEQKNALEMATKLEDHQVRVRILEMTRASGQHWYLVRTGEFDNQSSAETARKKLMQELGIDIIIRPRGIF